MAELDLAAELKKRADCFDQWLKREFAAQRKRPDSLFAAELLDAMEYSMLAGGKRLRPVLLMAAYEIFAGVDISSAVQQAGSGTIPGALAAPLNFALALEMIHTHSLVHDDLPAIDNDALRRGLPTTHAKYGEAMGVLAGDALLNGAYHCAAAAFDAEGVREDRVISALRCLIDRTGIGGMLGGQSVDVQNEKQGTNRLSREQLDAIYLHKTSALLEAALRIGGLLGGADTASLQKLEQIGRGLGLAFQIRDDILDVTSDEETLGKPVHSDEKNEKTTYVTLLGVEKASQEVARITGEVLSQIDTLPGETRFLRELAEYLAGRTK